MSESNKCDSCLKAVSEKDKYRLRCSGECRRYFCMSCTGLDKATTKAIYHQKYHNIRFFCSVCDSPTLKYLHDRVIQLQKTQISPDDIAALGTCLKRNNDLSPVISEIYDILSYHDAKWKALFNKMDEIYSLHTRNAGSDGESLFCSISEMKQDIFNLTSIFMDNQDDSIKIQFHDPSREGLMKQIGDLRTSVNQMALKVDNLVSKDKPNVRVSRAEVPSKSVTTQTDFNDSPIELAQKSSMKEDWQYVVVSGIPPSYTAKHLAHYVKEKLGTTDFIRCFPLLKNREGTDSDFKVGVQNKAFHKRLKDPSMWPRGTVITDHSKPSSHAGSLPVPPKVSPSPARTTTTRTPETVSSEVKLIQISSDKEAIAVSKSLDLDNHDIIVNKPTKNNEDLCLDPMSPPIVRLSRCSDLDNDRYLLARLRDPLILKPLRLFLAYLHDQPASTCMEGHTNTSIKLMLASEGLPSDVDSLRKLYYRFHNAYGIGPAEVEADLTSFGSYFRSENLLRLQKVRESHNNYFSGGSPTRNKNF